MRLVVLESRINYQRFRKYPSALPIGLPLDVSGVELVEPLLADVVEVEVDDVEVGRRAADAMLVRGTSWTTGCGLPMSQWCNGA